MVLGVLLIASCSADSATADVLAELQIESEKLNPYSHQVHGFVDYSPGVFRERLTSLHTLRSKILDIDRAGLSHFDKIRHDMILWDTDAAIDLAAHQWLWFPYTPYSFTLRGPPKVLVSYSFDSDDDIDGYLQLVSEIPDVLATMQDHIHAQREEGVYLPRQEAVHVRQQLLDYASGPNASFIWPKDSRLADLSEAGIERLRKSLRQLEVNKVNNAISDLANEFGDEYQNQAPVAYGLSQYPGGKEFYKALIKFHLTIDRSPEDLYRDSEAALHRLESELRSLRAEMGHMGERTEFDKRIMLSPQFIAESTDEVERVYLEYMTRIDPLMPILFCREAPFGYGVERATPDVEAALNYGNAGIQEKPVKLGMYWYNGSSLESRSLLPAQGLIYHELSPGHYWHAAMGTYSPVKGTNAGFSEAWADFAQILAYEQGVFRSPEEKYGRLAFVSMFYARALVDIGVNYFGRDFAWGRKTLRRYTFESDHQILRSLRRDTSDWQAQILPYSIGSHEILRLREKTRSALQEKFSEPRFYDAVLMTDAVPLPILEDHIDWFIAQEKSGGAPGICEE